MEERMRRLRLLNEAGRAMSGILDLDSLLDRILALVEEVFDFANCAILIYDPGANEMFVLKSIGYDPDVVRNLRIAPGQGITGAVLDEGRPIFVADVVHDERYIRGVPGAHSEVAAPLVADDQIMGVLDAETSTPARFDEADLDLFSMFASQAATAIANARLHYRLSLHTKVLEERIEQIGGLLGGLRQLNRGTDASAITRDLLLGAADASHSECCSLLLRCPGGLQEKARVGPGLFGADGGELPLEELGVLAEVFSAGEPRSVPNLLHDPVPLPAFPRGGTAMVAPLVAGEEVLGLLVCHCALGDPPGELDLALFAGFAGLASLLFRPRAGAKA